MSTPREEPDSLLLNRLRESRGWTQAELAGRLGTSQANVSRLERRRDIRLSSLREYVASLGGRLEITVHLPSGSVQLETPGPDLLPPRRRLEPVIHRYALDDRRAARDTLDWWMSRSGSERLAAVEKLRREFYGGPARLQRSARIIERASG
jgi:transcriptional regulator with XRE-family HTH domain